MEHHELPFRSSLSFEPIIRFWESKVEAENPAEQLLAQNLLDQLKDTPELRGEITDLTAIDKHRSLVNLLLSPVFPLGASPDEIRAVCHPFQMIPVQVTEKFASYADFERYDFKFGADVSEEDMCDRKTLNAYTYILKEHYGVELELDLDWTIQVEDRETNLKQYFKVGFNKDFMDIKALKPLKKLKKSDLRELRVNRNDINLWKKKLPIENFEFTGVVMISMVCITEQEVLSNLKNDLLRRDAVFSSNQMRGLESQMRSLFRLPQVRVGLASLGGNLTQSPYLIKRLWNGLLDSERAAELADGYFGSIYEKVVETGQILIVEDMNAIPEPTSLEKAMIDEGYQGLLIAPVFNDNELIGLLELGVPDCGVLGPHTAQKVEKVLPLFGVAMSRSIEELENEVQAVIKSEYTAIHPTVEWRFEEAAIAYLNERDADETPEPQSIDFPGVYPLYGLSDIRGSSMERNRSIQTDLTTHLHLIQEVLQAARQELNLPILDELGFRVSKHATHIRQGLNSGDESVVIDFIRQEVEPAFDHLATVNPNLDLAVKAYRGKLDPEHGIVYDQRKAYEDSIALINDTVSSVIEEEENVAQAMFPHYFEKYKTDGVDYNLYVGASIVQDREFDALYLNNFRLWQLIMMARVGRETYQLQNELPIPLRTTELVLVYSVPLAIRFRMDEKKFDVDGAYNMRYEIVKKRIDKAYIKNTEERVTQPGKIAIIYNQPHEAQEYGKYIEYMQDAGYLTETVEHVELEELQGVHGLKAIRVEINQDFEHRSMEIEEIMDALES